MLKKTVSRLLIRAKKKEVELKRLQKNVEKKSKESVIKNVKKMFYA